MKNKENKYDKTYLRMAREWGNLSYCKRRKVGALMENICEDDENYTKWYVLHAEANAIMKVASSTQSCAGATLYVTLSPCTDCSKLIYQAGIVRVVYIDQYKDTTGIQFLKDAGVEVVQIANPY